MVEGTFGIETVEDKNEREGASRFVVEDLFSQSAGKKSKRKPCVFQKVSGIEKR